MSLLGPEDKYDWLMSRANRLPSRDLIHLKRVAKSGSFQKSMNFFWTKFENICTDMNLNSRACKGDDNVCIS